MPRHMSKVYGASVSAANIHITAGCNQAFMSAAIALAGSGDTVALTNPFYFNQETTLSMLGIKRVLVECDAENGFLPEVQSAEKALAGRRQGAGGGDAEQSDGRGLSA